MKNRKTIVNILCYVLLAVLSFIWILPIFFAVLTSFRAESGAGVSYIFPKAYTLDNYIKLFTSTYVPV